jgi:predicted Fe-Mo cluster-binding NifX family protein
LNVINQENIMKIVISSSGPEMDAAVDPRFGRAAYFLIVDSDNGELLEAIDNSAGRDAAQGAGIGAAALVAEKGVTTILTGRVGPKAMAVVEKANIDVVSNVSGTVRDAVDQFRSGVLTGSGSGSAPTSQRETSGQGMGGRGMGQGGQSMMSTGQERAFGGGKGLGGGRRRPDGGCGCGGRGQGQGRGRGSGSCRRGR